MCLIESIFCPIGIADPAELEVFVVDINSSELANMLEKGKAFLRDHFPVSHVEPVS